MAEEVGTREPDLRAGHFVAGLRRSRGLSPEQMGKLCGVSGQTIRDIESKGTYPWPATRARIAAFFGIPEDHIWKDPRKPIRRKRSVSEKALAAVSAAMDDSSAREAVLRGDREEAFALGVAWAVIRAQSPFSTCGEATERALQAVEAWHGAGRSARAST